jgi:hypothetical protein
LNKAELFIDGSIITPESIAFRGDDVFTGTGDGAIIKVDKNGKMEKIVQLGHKDCGNRRISFIDNSWSLVQKMDHECNMNYSLYS